MKTNPTVHFISLCNIYFLFQQSEGLRDLDAAVNAPTVAVCQRDKGVFVIVLCWHN